MNLSVLELSLVTP